MQAYFRMNNDILDLGLSPNEIKVAVCLYSCVFKNNYYVQIKQSTIADRCGIRKTETVSNIICKLQRKGVIESVYRPHKKDGNLGTYIYKLKSIATRGFFKVKRYILAKLTGIQLRMYLFVCRAIVEKKNDMWNSFNDISRSLQIGRNKVVAVINELVELGVIVKSRVLKKDGRGRSKKVEEMNETERLRMENKILRAQLQDAEMENKLLKKLRELRGGGH